MSTEQDQSDTLRRAIENMKQSHTAFIAPMPQAPLKEIVDASAQTQKETTSSKYRCEYKKSARWKTNRRFLLKKKTYQR